MKPYTENQPIDVLVWDNKKKTSEWLQGTFITKVGAVDREHRYHVRLNDGREYPAAAPECVKPSGSLIPVRVVFEDTEHNYTTSVAAKITDVEARDYFVGKMFDVGQLNRENLQKCVKIVYNQEEDRI